MINEIFQKFKDITLNPVETFQKSRDEETGTAFVYFLAIIAVYSVLSGIVSMLFVGFLAAIVPAQNMFFTAETSVFMGLFSIISTFIGSIVGLVIGVLILHLFVYLLGGRKGLEQTLKAGIYSCTPLALIGWIPVVSIIAVIWGIVLEALAVRELHEISTARAVLAVILPVILLLGFLFLFVLMFLCFAVETTGPVMTSEFVME